MIAQKTVDANHSDKPWQAPIAASNLLTAAFWAFGYDHFFDAERVRAG